MFSLLKYYHHKNYVFIKLMNNDVTDLNKYFKQASTIILSIVVLYMCNYNVLFQSKLEFLLPCCIHGHWVICVGSVFTILLYCIIFLSIWHLVNIQYYKNNSDI